MFDHVLQRLKAQNEISRIPFAVHRLDEITNEIRAELPNDCATNFRVFCETKNRFRFTFESIQKEMEENDVNMVAARLRKRLNVNIGEDAFHHC